jgi:hypothetical protein
VGVLFSLQKLLRRPRASTAEPLTAFVDRFAFVFCIRAQAQITHLVFSDFMMQNYPLNNRHPFQRLHSNDAEQYQPYNAYQTPPRPVPWESSDHIPYKQEHPQAEVLPLTSTAPSHHAPPHISKLEKLSTRFRCDCAALTLCIVIWTLIAGSIASYVALYKLYQTSDGLMSTDDLMTTFVYGLGLAALGASLNEALVDRTWRRIKAQALRGSVKGDYLRAANFQLMDCLKRLFKGKLSKRELFTLVAYALLRWGTAFSFSSIQLVIKIVPHGEDRFASYYHYNYLPLPLALHVGSVFGSLAVSGLPPWSLFVNRYDKKVIYAAYRRYLDIVPYGSAATSDQVADLLDRTNLQPGPNDFCSLAVQHAPGLQLRKKLRGVMTGMLIIILAPTLAFWYQKTADKNGRAVARFTYSSTLSVLGTGYTFAESFAVWTLGLEGITSTPRSDTNWLGTTSGLMLLVKAFRQRRPVRVFFLYWIFWAHALFVRFLAWFLVVALSIHKLAPSQDEVLGLAGLKSLRTMFWPLGLWFLLLAPFLLWLVVPFKAPLAPMDQWRVSKILEGATNGKGRYGIEGQPGQGKAAWGLNTRVFTKEVLL